MKLSIKRAFYKDLAPNNLDLKIRSFRKRKDYIRNIEFETVMVSWKDDDKWQSLWFHYHISGSLLDIIIEYNANRRFVREAIPVDKILNENLVPQRIRDWLMFNLDVLK